MVDFYDNYAEAEASEFVYGNIYIDNGQELTRELYEKFFDEDMISFNMAKSIIADTSPENEQAVDLKALQEWVIEEIKDRVLSGNDYGTLDNGELSWSFNYELTGKLADKDFFDLSRYTQEYILNAMADGCKMVEVNEVITYDIDKYQELIDNEYFDYGDVPEHWKTRDFLDYASENAQYGWDEEEEFLNDFDLKPSLDEQLAGCKPEIQNNKNASEKEKFL